ncbi:CapA family protein [Geosporobacter ferrireducens]|uniref:ATP-grasp domain-containing protein n=1 Tax=Geosporobacter ferrireducens TaxID=1424294 RepID=A0A1D8GHN4_9FIRM|nr:CapA family protein [Geosporobacter ferrireducens]AOT70412.1 hypothetical protein Gferi_12970 [Geosporobacter ferrireducens]
MKFTLTFAGDTSLGEWYLRKPGKEELVKRLEENPFSFFEGVKPLVEGSNFFILNFESVLADHPSSGIEGKEYPNWDQPKRMLDVLHRLGVTAVGMTNNHTMDFGANIMLSTKKEIEASGIATFGSGESISEAAKPCIMRLEGEYSSKNVYILTGMRASRRYEVDYKFFAEEYRPGINTLDQQQMVDQITQLRMEDWEGIIIVYPHWQGLDYRFASENSNIQKRCRAFIEAGADYVFGHGPHIINDIEKYRDGTIVYSIGNFIFNSPGRYEKMQAPPYSFVVQLKLEEGSDSWHIEERYYPILSDNKITQFKSRPIEENEVEDLEGFIKDKAYEGLQNTYVLKKDHRGYYYSFDYARTEHSIDRSTCNIDYELFKPLIGKTQNIYNEGRFSVKKLLAEEFARLGYESKSLGKYLVANLENTKLCFLETESSNTSLLGWRILKNKAVAREFLMDAGVAITKGKLFFERQKEEAEKFAKSLKSYVVKPADGNRGSGITVGASDFDSAWNTALSISSTGILIEEQFIGGTEARYLVVGNQCVAVIKRIPPHVIGNGMDTVEMLIHKKNDIRLKNPALCYRLIKMNEHRLSIIQDQGFKLDSIPKKDQVVLIDWKGGLSTGADSYDITDEVHPLFKRIAEKVSMIAPGLDIIGVDILAFDHSKKPNRRNYIVVEANTRPDIGGHHYPVYGKARNVARCIVEHNLRLLQK